MSAVLCFLEYCIRIGYGHICPRKRYGKSSFISQEYPQYRPESPIRFYFTYILINYNYENASRQISLVSSFVIHPDLSFRHSSHQEDTLIIFSHHHYYYLHTLDDNTYSFSFTGFHVATRRNVVSHLHCCSSLPREFAAHPCLSCVFKPASKQVAQARRSRSLYSRTRPSCFCSLVVNRVRHSRLIFSRGDFLLQF